MYKSEISHNGTLPSMPDLSTSKRQLIRQVTSTTNYINITRRLEDPNLFDLEIHSGQSENSTISLFHNMFLHGLPLIHRQHGSLTLPFALSAALLGVFLLQRMQLSLFSCSQLLAPAEASTFHQNLGVVFEPLVVEGVQVQVWELERNKALLRDSGRSKRSSQFFNDFSTPFSIRGLTQQKHNLDSQWTFSMATPRYPGSPSSENLRYALPDSKDL
nr:unnamed protein product [Callosobruchus analis]